MEQTVDNVKAELALKSISKSAGMPTRRLRANENFAVLKSHHVGWSGFFHELSMERRHLSIGDNQHRNLGKLTEIGRFVARQPKATFNRFLRERLKIDSVDWNFALKIADNDFWHS